MKNLLLKFTSLMFVVSLGSCDNSSQSVISEPTPVSTKQNMEQLVALGINFEATQAQTQSFIKAYQGLNFEELEEFNHILADKSIDKLLEDYSLSNGRIRQEDKVTVQLEIDRLSHYRSEVNKQAFKQYGKSYSQLDAATLEALSSKIPVTFSSDMIGNRTDATSKVMACGSASFPSTATRISNAGASHTTWTRRATPNAPNDCDYEYKYNNSRNTFTPRNPLSSTLCDSFGNRLAYRYSNYATYLLFGATRVQLITGTAFLDVDMR